MDNGAVIGGNGRLDYSEMTANLVAAYVSHIALQPRRYRR